MSLNIKNPQVERLAGSLARAVGTNKTQAILLALREKMETLKFKKSAKRIQADLLEIASRAFIRYDKGRHPAALNFGDCCVYALARFFEKPLLFKGADFAQTDIARVSAL